MKCALFSDIHANLPALEAVLADIDRRPDVAAMYHLGDLVGYSPWPNEVVELLTSRAVPGIAGIPLPPPTTSIAAAGTRTLTRRSWRIRATNGRGRGSRP